MSAISSLTHAISLDPYSGEQIGAYPFDTDAALEAALQRAKVGYRQWRQVSLGQRSEYLLALASTLETKAEAFAQMISREIGKPVAQARGEVGKCVSLCRWYAEYGPAMLAAEPTQVVLQTRGAGIFQYILGHHADRLRGFVQGGVGAGGTGRAGSLVAIDRAIGTFAVGAAGDVQGLEFDLGGFAERFRLGKGQRGDSMKHTKRNERATHRRYDPGVGR